jgi:hypothetical protein
MLINNPALDRIMFLRQSVLREIRCTRFGTKETDRPFYPGNLLTWFRLRWELTLFN